MLTGGLIIVKINILLTFLLGKKIRCEVLSVYFVHLRFELYSWLMLCKHEGLLKV